MFRVLKNGVVVSSGGRQPAHVTRGERATADSSERGRRRVCKREKSNNWAAGCRIQKQNKNSNLEVFCDGRYREGGMHCSDSIAYLGT